MLVREFILNDHLLKEKNFGGLTNPTIEIVYEVVVYNKEYL